MKRFLIVTILLLFSATVNSYNNNILLFIDGQEFTLASFNYAPGISIEIETVEQIYDCQTNLIFRTRFEDK